MPCAKLLEYLTENKVDFELIEHPNAYAAQDVAFKSGVPGRLFAKTVMVKLDGKLAMVVIPASRQLKLTQLGKSLGAKNVELATEDDFRDAFPDCEPGAMPPFGNLYGMPVFVSETLREDDEIAFNAGSHSELIRLPYSEYERVVKPTPLAA